VQRRAFVAKPNVFDIVVGRSVGTSLRSARWLVRRAKRGGRWVMIAMSELLKSPVVTETYKRAHGGRAPLTRGEALSAVVLQFGANFLKKGGAAMPFRNRGRPLPVASMMRWCLTFLRRSRSGRSRFSSKQDEAYTTVADATNFKQLDKLAFCADAHRNFMGSTHADGVLPKELLDAKPSVVCNVYRQSREDGRRLFTCLSIVERDTNAAKNQALLTLLLGLRPGTRGGAAHARNSRAHFCRPLSA
jgi:hypothetical protein